MGPSSRAAGNLGNGFPTKAVKNTQSTVGRVSRLAAKGRPARVLRAVKAQERPVNAPRRQAARPPERSANDAEAGNRRTWFVLCALVGMLAFTGALLKALAPAPLTPDATASLFALGQAQSFDQIFETPVALRGGHWKSIYIHQSLTPSGNALSLGQAEGGMADHFLIGNGDGLTDGAVQTGPRWSQQLAPGEVPGVEIRPDCISICVVGDFNRGRPTATQQARLVELVSTLRRQLGIAPEQVVLRAGDSSVAGVGKRFPTSSIAAQLAQ